MNRLSILGAAGSVVTYNMTVTIIPFMPSGWAESAGGFPAMTLDDKVACWPPPLLSRSFASASGASKARPAAGDWADWLGALHEVAGGGDGAIDGAAAALFADRVTYVEAGDEISSHLFRGAFAARRAWR
jgi:hypothetical protein